jgi:N-methylhydantoinase B
MTAHGSSADIDPITLEVVRHKLEGIANEMEVTLLKSSFSPIVKEGQDASATLFTVNGETLAQAIAIPIHMATLVPIVHRILESYPLAEMREGDIYIMNDPYLGGTHLPDIALVMPVFHAGRAVALSACLTHHQDVGGMTPGSLPTNATEIFQEGIRIPPLKLHSGGAENETLVQLLRRNVRVPETFMGDLNAQVAACTVGARRLGELASRYGHNRLTGIFEELLDRSEAMTRAALGRIPRGTYHYVDYLDNDGIELERRVRIEVSVTVEGGHLSCDFTGTSAQVKGPLNCVPSGSYAAAYFAVRALTDATIPTNGGCFRPVSLTLPAGSLVNPIEPAPVNARTPTIKRIATSILGALKDVAPEKVPADSAGETITQTFGLRRPGGTTFVAGEMLAGGSGASAARDGVDMIDTDATNCMNLPVEALETDLPMRMRRFALARDSGGPGRFRGGLGCIREYEVVDGEITFIHRGERYYQACEGARSGQAGAFARGTVYRANGSEESIPSKLVTVLRQGDRLLLVTPGGGGFGDPKQRDRARLAADIQNGKVSPEAAEDIYGYNPARE